MKSSFVRLTNITKGNRLSKIAVLMCVVLLTAAICFGAMLSSVATSESSGALLKAVTGAHQAYAGQHIVDVTSEKVEKITSGKSDLASTGGSADLAATGYDGTASILCMKNGYTAGSFGYTASINNNNATFSIDLAKEVIEGGYWFFKTRANDNVFGGAYEISPSGTTLYNGYADAAKIPVSDALMDHTITVTVHYDYAGTTVSWSDSGTVNTQPEIYIYGVGFSSATNNWDLSDLTKASHMTKQSRSLYYFDHTVADNDEFAFYSTPHDSHYRVETATHLATSGTKVSIKYGSSNPTFYLDNFTSGDNVRIWFDRRMGQVWAERLEPTHDVTFSVGSGTGTISPSGTEAVGEETKTDVTATAGEGYAWSSWSAGDGITLSDDTADGDNRTAKIVTNSSGTYTLAANFSKKSYTLSKGAETNGSFTISPDHNSSVQYQSTVDISGITPETGYELSTVTYTCGGVTTAATDDGDGTYSFAMPAGNTTVNVSFAKIDYTVSTSVDPDDSGTVVVSKASGGSSTATYNIGDTLYITATAEPAYNLTSVTVDYGDSTPDYTNSSVASGEEFSINMTGHTGNITVSATFTLKPLRSVTVSTNDAIYGTVSSDPVTAYDGQTVTLTATEVDGDFDKWVVVSGGVTLDSATAKTTTFTMGSQPVVIRGLFDLHSTGSNYYYNGYAETTDGDKTVAAQIPKYFAQRMTEAKVGGETFSYYHVTGRDDENQLFTVSYGSPDHGGTIYFERPDSWNDKMGWTSGDVEAIFFSSDNITVQNWTYMTKDSDNVGNGNTRWRISVPDNARQVQFKASSSAYTTWIDLNTGNNSDTFYLRSSNKSGTDFSDIGNYRHYNDNPVGNFYEEFYSSSVYKNTFSTGGFASASAYYSSSGAASHNFVKPSSLSTYSDDYYILVLYNGKSYTIGETTYTVTESPLIIWSPTLPTDDVTNSVKIYAKDGAVRDSDNKTYADYADTKIYSSGIAVGTSHTVSTDETYETYTARKGETITISTTLAHQAYTIDSTTKYFDEQYYVKGFSINGVVPSLNSGVVDGDTKTYTLTYTVPEDFEGEFIEITPIYYLADTENNSVVTFYVEDFTPEMRTIGYDQPNWGNTLYAYPYYGRLSSYNNAFGSYPGQPMICHNGRYYIQVPVLDTSPFDIASGTYDNANLTGETAVKMATRAAYSISGISIHNGYYDSLHRELMGYQDALRYQAQSYDFDNFYKIKSEDPDASNIVFRFKPEYTTNNRDILESFTPSDAASFTTAFVNGFEDLTNFSGAHIDIFNTVISDPANLAYNPIYVVSKGGESGNQVKNFAGNYATEWVIYVPSSPTGAATYSLFTDDEEDGKTSIPSSLLVLDNEADLNDDTYPSAIDGDQYKVSAWATYWSELKSGYAQYPVKITYEKAKANSDNNGTHFDGQWVFSRSGESITSTIRVDVSVDNGVTYYPNGDAVHIPAETYGGPTVANLNASFTNLGVEGQSTYATSIDPTKTFNFTASSSNDDYIFVGWYLDNGTEITKDNVAEIERTASYTLVARFKYVSAGSLTLAHNLATGTVSDTVYNGSGTTTIAVTVKDAVGNPIRTVAATTSDVTLDGKYISTEHLDYSIEVTLGATPIGEDTFGVVTTSAASTFMGNNTSYNSVPPTFSFSVYDLFSSGTQTVKKLTYNSYFNKMNYNYNVTFTYRSRMTASGTRQDLSFNRHGTLTAAEREAYVSDSGGETRTLSEAFLNMLVPHETNFGETITWTFSDRSFTGPVNNTYTLTRTYTATVVDNKTTYDAIGSPTEEQTNQYCATATFVLPFTYDDYGKYSSDIYSTPANFVVKVPVGAITKKDYNHLVSDPEYGEAYKNTYVTAPLEITGHPDGSKFQYWAIKRTSDNRLISKCYSDRFNFAIYENCTITPVYGNSDVDLSGVSTAISFIETSRNQWNGNVVPLDTLAATKYNAASDILFNDFVISYSHNGDNVDSLDSSRVKIGFVVQRIAHLDQDGAGNTITDNTYYASKYSANTPNSATITSMITDGMTGASDFGTYYNNVAISLDSVGNRGRVQWFYTLFNSYGWNDAEQSAEQSLAYKNYIYRAYSYIYEAASGTPLTLSDPVYFNVYDIATQ